MTASFSIHFEVSAAPDNSQYPVAATLSVFNDIRERLAHQKNEKDPLTISDFSLKGEPQIVKLTVYAVESSGLFDLQFIT